MLKSLVASPLLHGQLGAVDEILMFCLPVVVAIVVLALSARRARRGEQTRARTRDAGREDAESAEDK